MSQAAVPPRSAHLEAAVASEVPPGLPVGTAMRLGRLLSILLLLAGCAPSAPPDDDDSAADDDDAVQDDDDAVQDDDDDAVQDDDDDDAVQDDDDDDAVQDDDDDDDAVQDDDDFEAGNDTLWEVQTGAIPPGTYVTLRWLTVIGVALDSSGVGYGLYVQEGWNSWNNSVWVEVGAGAEAFSIGDQVDVAGWTEEYDGGGTWTETRTQINVADHPADSGVVSLGSTDPVELYDGQSAAFLDPADIERFEGGLVRLDAVVVQNPNLAPGRFSITDDVVVGDQMIDLSGAVAAGDTIGTLVGIVDHVDGVYVLNPRNAGDLVEHHSSPLPIEAVAPGDLVITEVLPEGDGSSSFETCWYVEFTYVGSAPADLKGLTFGQEGENGQTVFDDLPVSSGDRVVVRRERASPCFGFSGPVVDRNQVFAGQLRVGTPSGVLLDAAQRSSYSMGSHVAQGLSPLLLDATSNDNATSWCDQTTAITGGVGTPGAPNDPC